MDHHFPTTEWDQLDAAARDRTSRNTAFQEICRAYWYPLYAFIRSRGYTPDRAEDLTQAYFARLMEGHLLQRADRERGRFRALLRRDCTFFLADMSDHERAAKRGGGRAPLSLDAAAAEQRYHLDPVHHHRPEQVFDRAWALDLLSRAMSKLERAEREAGRGESFAVLRHVVAGPSANNSYHALAKTLGTTEAAIEGAVRRLRGRYRRALRATIAETLLNPSDSEIDEEIRALFDALRISGDGS